MIELNLQLNRKVRGYACTVEEFQLKYGIAPELAQRLHQQFGPSSTDLDLLMSAKGILPDRKTGTGRRQSQV